MLFNSLHFAIFFPIVTLLYFVLPHRLRVWLLFVASCYFYMAFVPKYILILFVLILVDYTAGILLENAPQSRKKGIPGPEGSVGKLAMALLNQRMMDFAMDLMGAEAMLLPDSLKMAINYGLEEVRFLAPVRSGKRVRGRFTLDSVEEKGPGRVLMRHRVSVEIEGEDKPALTALWLGLMVI